MFDLGLTLIDEQNRPFEHVPEALAAITKFKTSDKKPLRCCLVSDFTMATPPVTATKVRPLFEQYLQILDSTGLRRFFEPVDRRVTLSTHANALKPDRAVFEMALHRLRVEATFEECLFITENTAHIKAARKTLHMQTLQFSATSSRPFDFDDWAQAPALVAHLVDPLHTPNVHAAVEVFLKAKGVELTNLDGAGAAGKFNAEGRVWHPVDVPVSGVESLFTSPCRFVVPSRSTPRVPFVPACRHQRTKMLPRLRTMWAASPLTAKSRQRLRRSQRVRRTKSRSTTVAVNDSFVSASALCSEHGQQHEHWNRTRFNTLVPPTDLTAWVVWLGCWLAATALFLGLPNSMRPWASNDSTKAWTSVSVSVV